MSLTGIEPLSNSADDAGLLEVETLHVVQDALDQLRRAAALRSHLAALLAWLEERSPPRIDAELVGT